MPSKIMNFIPAIVLAVSTLAHAHGAKKHGEIAADALDSLYVSYLEIQGALSGDDLETARAAGRAFLGKPIKLPRELSHSVSAKALLQDFRALNGAKSLEAGRKAFSGFSDRMVLLMKEAGYQGRDSVILFHCPMANGGKGGQWLQNRSALHNPYFGKEMPDCGTEKERLYPAPGSAESAGEAEKPGQDGNHGRHH